MLGGGGAGCGCGGVVVDVVAVVVAAICVVVVGTGVVGAGVVHVEAGAAVLLACREVSSVFEGLTPPPPCHSPCWSCRRTCSPWSRPRRPTCRSWRGSPRSPACRWCCWAGLDTSWWYIAQLDILLKKASKYFYTLRIHRCQRKTDLRTSKCANFRWRQLV